MGFVCFVAFVAGALVVVFVKQAKPIGAPPALTRLDDKATPPKQKPTPLKQANARPTPTEAAESTPTVPPRPIDPPPILPTYGANPHYSFVLEQCTRTGERIVCWGYAGNKTDAPEKLNLYSGEATDDEGNTLTTWSMHYSDGSKSVKLLPGGKVRFEIVVPDAHLNVKTISLDLHVRFSAFESDEPIFPDVPVQ